MLYYLTMGKDATYEIGWERASYASDESLATWAADDNCLDKKAILKVIDERREKAEKDEEALALRKIALEARPFDPRTELSADGKRIVKHLWIIFVVIPTIVTLLYFAIRAAN